MIIKAVTAAEMREIDRISIEELGIPSSVLMNNAGKAIADFITEKFPGKKISIFCGTGNNGGDGFTAAWYLFNRGYNPVIYISGKISRISETSLIFLIICRKSGIEIREIDENPLPTISFPQDSVIIDAILGTGFEGQAAGIPLEFIKIINESSAPVVSIDIPSGLSSDGTISEGHFVRSDYTVTIGLPKISLMTFPCREFCGEVITVDIGFPRSLTMSDNLKVTLINDDLFRTISTHDNPPDIHKGNRGHTLIAGGFRGMEGAALMTASALFSTGCGLLTIATEKKSRKIIAGKIPEAMTVSLPPDPGSLVPEELFASGGFTFLIIGPGLGRTAYAETVFYKIISSLGKTGIKKVLIDGDGLYHLAEFLNGNELPRCAEFIITPHFMEASRIIKKSIIDIKNDRLRACVELARCTGCVAVLKGPASIISDGDRSFINTTGNNGLATAGSGDVLSGITGSFMNMNIPLIEAATAGVFIHGLCADIYTETNISSTMKASDIINNIRNALNRKNV